MGETTGIGIDAAGTPVKPGELGTRAGATSAVLFALADSGSLFGTVYPAISTDGGSMWRIDGPRFYYAAAQGADVTENIGASPPESAFAWGQGGNFVRVTRDGGDRWFAIDFPAGVVSVWSQGGKLFARTFGPPHGGAASKTLVYVSLDHGMTWTLRREPATPS